MQLSTVSAQLRLGSELVDWFRGTMSVPYDQLLIDFVARTDDKLRCCTNRGSVLSKFWIPERLKQFRSSDGEHTKSLYSPGVSILFPQIRKSFPSDLARRVYAVSLRMQNEYDQRKPTKHEKTSRGKISRQQSSVAFSGENNLEAEKTHSGVRKKLANIRSHYSSPH